MLLRSAVVTLILSAMPASLLAAPITYQVSETVAGASASGTITTDGSLGTLTSTDILSFSLTLASGTNSDVIQTTTAMQGSALSATSTGLFYNFSAAGSFLGLSDTSVSDGLCFGPCLNQPGSGIAIFINRVFYDGSPLTGTQQIAFTSTPEPSSFALLGTGLLSLAGVRRRRSV